MPEIKLYEKENATATKITENNLKYVVVDPTTLVNGDMIKIISPQRISVSYDIGEEYDAYHLAETLFTNDVELSLLPLHKVIGKLDNTTLVTASDSYPDNLSKIDMWDYVFFKEVPVAKPVGYKATLEITNPYLLVMLRYFFGDISPDSAEACVKTYMQLLDGLKIDDRLAPTQEFVDFISESFYNEDLHQKTLVDAREESLYITEALCEIAGVRPFTLTRS